MPEPQPAVRPRGGFRRELADAISVRTTLLVIGVAALQLGFITSYIGAFHKPTPHEIPVAVVVPKSLRADALKRLDTLPGKPVLAHAVATEQAGARQLRERAVYGTLVFDAAGKDQLLVASASGVSAATAVETIFALVEAHLHRHFTTHNLRPPAPGDYNGLSSFYLVVGWIVGGYLAAALLGISSGARPANPSRATIRLGALAVYAVATGVGGALIAGPILHALPGGAAGVGRLWWIGALLVFAAGAFSVASQVVAGTVGIGLTVLLFVILGNPSSGGPYAWSLLPPFWRAIGPWIPTGAGTNAVRGIAYFGGSEITTSALVIGGYAAAGVAVTYLWTISAKRGSAASLAERSDRSSGSTGSGHGMPSAGSRA